MPQIRLKNFNEVKRDVWKDVQSESANGKRRKNLRNPNGIERI